MRTAGGHQPFNVSPLLTKLPGPVAKMIRRPLERVLCFRELNAFYKEANASTAAANFCESALASMGVTVRARQEDLNRIPKTGPLIVVANHPFGGIEGLIMAAVLLRVRPDAKVLANFLLAAMPEMQQFCIFVDPFEGRGVKPINIRGLKESLRWLGGGGALGVFPSGEVSHLDLATRRIADPKWNQHVAALARRSGAQVVTMYFDGANGALFHMAGLIHPRLRTVLLPRELANKRNGEFTVHIGNPLPADTLNRIPDDGAYAQYLRLRTYALIGRTGSRAKFKRAAVRLRRIRRMGRLRTPAAPIAKAGGIDPLTSQIASLPDSAFLADASELEVYVIDATQAPAIMQEIGRLREVTFRAVGEGSRKARDLDEFDHWYQHLVVWNKEKSEVVGSYRLGPTDRIDPAAGRASLYTSTLFTLKREFFDGLGAPGIELGRSFVRTEYQKSFSPLMLLWRGIGRFLALHPRYRYLFGPVSIPARYSRISKAVITEYLSRPENRSPLAEHVIAPRPFVPRKGVELEVLQLAHTLKNSDELDDLICDIEPDGRGVPILIKQYLRLGARSLAFSVDPEFGNCLDCLYLLDMLAIDTRSVQKYMGKEHWAQYLAAQKKPVIA